MTVEKWLREKLRKNTRLTATDLFFKKDSPGFISSSDSVLVVGPGIERMNGVNSGWLPMDRSLTVLPPYLVSGSGDITVLDLPGKSEKYEESWGNLSGYHDLAKVKDYIEFLGTLLAICPTSYVEADLLDPILGSKIDKRFDVINDHLTTLRWILRNNFQDAAQSIAKLYNNLLRDRGKALLFYTNEDKVTDVINVFEEAGFQVADLQINDLYDFPQALRPEFAGKKTAFTQLLSDGKLKPAFSADGVLVAQKIQH